MTNTHELNIADARDVIGRGKPLWVSVTVLRGYGGAKELDKAAQLLAQDIGATHYRQLNHLAGLEVESGAGTEYGMLFSRVIDDGAQA